MCKHCCLGGSKAAWVPDAGSALCQKQSCCPHHLGAVEGLPDMWQMTSRFASTYGSLYRKMPTAMRMFSGHQSSGGLVCSFDLTWQCIIGLLDRPQQLAGRGRRHKCIVPGILSQGLILAPGSWTGHWGPHHSQLPLRLDSREARRGPQGHVIPTGRSPNQLD